MPVVWITRARDGALRTQKAVAAKGFDTLVAPVLAIHDLSAAIDPDAFDALIVTSRAGLNAFARLCPRRDLPVWCVGDATAQAAQDLGFADTTSASGDVEALRDLMKAKALRTSRYLYACAAEPAAPLTAWLWAEGLRVTQTAVYETRETDPHLTPEQLATITHVLLHSARAARATAAFLSAQAADFVVEDLTFICLSEAIAQTLETTLKAAGKNYPAAGITKSISPFPDEASMLMLLT